MPPSSLSGHIGPATAPVSFLRAPPARRADPPMETMRVEIQIETPHPFDKQLEGGQFALVGPLRQSAHHGLQRRHAPHGIAYAHRHGLPQRGFQYHPGIAVSPRPTAGVPRATLLEPEVRGWQALLLPDSLDSGAAQPPADCRSRSVTSRWPYCPARPNSRSPSRPYARSGVLVASEALFSRSVLLARTDFKSVFGIVDFRKRNGANAQGSLNRDIRAVRSQ